jgi:hypothetical protein
MIVYKMVFDSSLIPSVCSQSVKFVKIAKMHHSTLVS